MSHYYAKFKENPCVGTDASTPLSYSEHSVVLACDPSSKRTMDNPMFNASNQKKASGQGSGSFVMLDCIDA